MSISYSPDGGESWINLEGPILVRVAQVDTNNGTPYMLEHRFDGEGVEASLHPTFEYRSLSSSYRPHENLTKTLLEGIEE